VKPGTVFYKMSGSGNDFIVVDGRFAGVADFTPSAIAAACDRRLGIGADGVILLDPEAPAGAHFTFRYWNSDGSEGPMCGNGALCATRLAAAIELAPPEGDVVFATAAGLHRGRVREGRAMIDLPDCPPPRTVNVPLQAGESAPMFAEPSVPHLVLQVADVETVDVAGRGPTLRFDGLLPPGGANVNWIAALDDGSWRMRTYERGVEAETLACGTGAVACAVVLAATTSARSPTRLWTRSRMPLDVSWTRRGGAFTNLSLSGDARTVFKGTAQELVIPTTS